MRLRRRVKVAAKGAPKELFHLDQHTSSSPRYINSKRQSCNLEAHAQPYNNLSRTARAASSDAMPSIIQTVELCVAPLSLNGLLVYARLCVCDVRILHVVWLNATCCACCCYVCWCVRCVRYVLNVKRVFSTSDVSVLCFAHDVCSVHWCRE